MNSKSVKGGKGNIEKGPVKSTRIGKISMKKAVPAPPKSGKQKPLPKIGK